MISVLRILVPLVCLIATVGPDSLIAAPRNQAAATVEMVCAVAVHPEAYRGRRVSVRGRVYEVFGRMYLRDDSCPESVRLVVSKNPIDSQSARRIADFRKYISARVRPRARHSVCAGCNRYRVQGTVTGRVSLEPQRAAGSLQRQRSVLMIDDVSGLEAEDLYGSFYSAAQYEPALAALSDRR